MAVISLKLGKPFKTVSVYNINAKTVSGSSAPEMTEQLKNQMDLYNQACIVIQNLAEKLKNIYQNVIAERNEEITRLSVEIARKVLMQTVQQGDYKIEEIIKEILKNSPSQHDLIVHLNPKDLADIQKITQDNQELFPGIKLVPDNNVGLAECILESPRGIIKSLIDEHLEQIGKALKKAG